MRIIPGATWQRVTAVAVLVICFCLGVHCGRYLERGPELPLDVFTPDETTLSLADPIAEQEEQTIRTALKKQISIELTSTPFADFFQYFRDESKLNCHIDPRAEHALHIMGNKVVTCNLTDVTLQSFLDTVLHERSLDWTIRNGVLVVITRDMAAERLETRVYPVRDLGQAPRFRGPEAPRDPVIAVIEDSVKPGSWMQTGGPASIERFPNTDSLVIRQTRGAHDEIARLLTQVRKSRQLQSQATKE